jgi:hypothetical protein
LYGRVHARLYPQLHGRFHYLIMYIMSAAFTLDLAVQR